MKLNRFSDRYDAGRRLATALYRFRETNPIVLGLPRGGVPVASEVAKALQAPLDVLIVRKLGAPWRPELAIGAIGEGGAHYVDEALVNALGVSGAVLQAIITKELAELDRRVKRYRQDRPMLSLTGHTVIIVDDGIATGASARAALQVVRNHHPDRVVLAAPVAALDSVQALNAHADQLVVLEQPRFFNSVGNWYDDFDQTPDQEVLRLLSRPARTGSPRLATQRASVTEFPQEVHQP
jgi:putative phosphoribosyl transferase